MLKQSGRLSRNQAGWLLKKGDKFSNEFFSIKFRLNKKPFCRYSVVVSKKLLKLATDRNLLRRQLYEILRQRPASPESFDFSILVRPAVLKLDFAAKQEKLLSTLNQISSTSAPQNG